MDESYQKYTAFLFKERRNQMFQCGEIVMYRFTVSQIKEIVHEKNHDFYLLHSLDQEYTIFKVPCENEFGHIQPLPSKKELEESLLQIPNLICYEIPRNPGSHYYQEIINTNQLSTWLTLLKTIYCNRLRAVQNHKRINQKQKQYYDFILSKLSAIYAAVLGKTAGQCETLILDAFNQYAVN